MSRSARRGLYAILAAGLVAALLVASGLLRDDGAPRPTSALTLSDPVNGSAVRDPTPTLDGATRSASGPASAISVAIFAGTRASGRPLRTLIAERDGRSWSAGPAQELAQGTYTATARLATGGGRVRTSAPSTFTIDTAAPAPTIAGAVGRGGVPAAAEPVLRGSAGSAFGDSQTVTVRLYAGDGASGTQLQTLKTTRSGAAWSATGFAPLAPGRYSARAEQADLARHVGTSAARTFTIPARPVRPPYRGYRDTVLADGPRAYWRLGEAPGARDAVSDGPGRLRARYESGVRLGQLGALAGAADRSAGFDGEDDHLIAEGGALNVTRGASVEAWVKRSKSSSFQVIVGRPGDGESKNEAYALWLNDDDELVGYFGDGRSFASVRSSGPLDTRWHHVVTTYDNATAKLYVDGGLDASATSPVRLTANRRPLHIGRAANRDYAFGGQIDDVAVYGHVLTAERVGEHYAVGSGSAATGPSVTVSTPESGSVTADRTPAFAGQAGRGPAVSSKVLVAVHRGARATGRPIRRLAATRSASGSWTVDAAEPLAPGTYTARARQAGSHGTVGASVPQTFTVAARRPAGGDAILVGAGDIAYCDGTGDEATAALLDRYRAATVFTLGDNAYEYGTEREFRRCYDPTWGRAKARTRPSLGDHDYGDGRDPRATAYFRYFQAQLRPFGDRAGDPAGGYYSYEAGSWHVVTLNAVCGSDVAPGCDAEAQLSWLRDDLAAHPASCTLAILSSPRFSSGSIHGNNREMDRYWKPLHEAGAELVLSGDDHDYERFAPQDPGGNHDPDGIRQIVVGTGGRSLYPFRGGIVRANSEVRDDRTYGVLALVLKLGAYAWEFVPEAGKAFVDSGSDSCH